MDKIGRAYGAGLAGGELDPLKFIRKPRVILRLVSWVFSIIIFGCIASGGWIKAEGISEKEECVFGGDSAACSFGTAIGVIAFITCIAFMVIDIRFPSISSIQLRKQVVIADMAGSGVGAFLLFVTFCYLTNKWTTRGEAFRLSDFSTSNPQAAIAFSFFSIFTWAGLAFFGWRRYQEGAASAFAPTFEQDGAEGQPGTQQYAGYPISQSGDLGTQSYQEPPFTANNPTPQYQQPTY